MGKFDGLLLVSDFDDTLYDSHHRVPPRNLAAINYWLREGGRFTVATGRAYTTFAPYVHLAPINAPVVLSNGSAIYDFHTDTMLLETQLDPRAPQDFQALMDAMPSLGMEAYHGEDIYVYRPNYVTYGHMRKVGTDYTVAPIADMPTPWNKVIVQQEYDQLLRARAWLEEHCPERYEAIFSNRYYLEVTRRGCNKGGMVQRLIDMLGVERDNLYCVGDNQNDIPMMPCPPSPSRRPTAPRRSRTGAPSCCATATRVSSATSWRSWTGNIEHHLPALQMGIDKEGRGVDNKPVPAKAGTFFGRKIQWGARER